jgi:hydroxymethylpyrimidine pyrophosphatase-like HAD family hydrolase
MRRKEKIYVVPKYINKGAAVIKIYASLGARCLVAAGDSEADISMLTRADYALIPSEKHADRLHAAPAHVIIKPEGIDFASFILCFSSKLLKS